MDEINGDIKSGEYKRVYLIYGEERYLTRLYAAKLAAAIVPEDESGMNKTVFDDSGDGQAIIDALETVSFLAERRVALVKNRGLFAAKGAKAEGDDEPTGGKDAALLAEYIKDIPESATLILREQTADKRLKLYKECAKAGRVCELTPPPERFVCKWIAREVTKRGRRIGAGAAAYLYSIDQNMDTIEMEIEKLTAYCDDEITKVDIDALCHRPLEARIFDMTDAIAEGNRALAIKRYEDLIAIREPPLMILAMIARQFRNMLYCKSLPGGSAEIGARLGIKPYAVGIAIRQAKAFTAERLAEALGFCLYADESIKTGKTSDDLAVAMLTARLAGGDPQKSAGW